eukprot:1158912-Pelagomonas_calceolata.AAC.6
MVKYRFLRSSLAAPHQLLCLLTTRSRPVRWGRSVCHAGMDSSKEARLEEAAAREEVEAL